MSTPSRTAATSSTATRAGWAARASSKRLGSPYVSGRTRHWIKFKNLAAPVVKREAEGEWGK